MKQRGWNLQQLISYLGHNDDDRSDMSHNNQVRNNHSRDDREANDCKRFYHITKIQLF